RRDRDHRRGRAGRARDRDLCDSRARGDRAVNLARHLIRAARAFPERPALAHGARVVATWRQMAIDVARLAGALRMDRGMDGGLAPGARVALVMRNSPAY